MCTRYYVELSPELRPFIDAAGRSPLKAGMVSKLGKPFKSQGEIFPTDMAAVIAPDRRGMKAAFPMVWGYTVPGLGHPVVNARIESARYKKTFAEDWIRHRCVIPATCYIEWEHIKKPDGKVVPGSRYAIQPEGADVTYLAGLYRIEETRGFRYPVFTVLTREPSPELLKIHDRMPLILPQEAMDDWIDPEKDPDDAASKALTDMVAVRNDG